MTHYQKLEYQRRYNAEHKEQLKAYYQKNKEKINAYSKNIIVKTRICGKIFTIHGQ